VHRRRRTRGDGGAKAKRASKIAMAGERDGIREHREGEGR
jgi:hypothetical protein